MLTKLPVKLILTALSFCCLSFTFIQPELFQSGQEHTADEQPNPGLQYELDGGNGAHAAGAMAKVTSVATVVTKALYFKSLLTTAQQSTLQQTYTATLAKKWSNLPCGSSCRNGIQFSTLTSTQLAAALDVIAEAAGAVSGDGAQEFNYIRYADAYLHNNGGGSGYDSGIYFISFLNIPSTTGAWMLQYGGHHYAANIAFNGGNVIGVTPSFQGVEPLSFTSNGTTIAPLSDEQSALTAMLASLSSTQLNTAKITGTTYSDCTLIPGETNGGSGTFPTTKVGLSCSTLNATQQALVLAAIQHYVQDYDATSAATLMTVYTNEINNTYIAWTGSGTAGNASTFLNANTNYVRIDGTSVWIEFICQNGVVLSGIHYHTVFRDHTRDYGNNLSNTTLPITLVSFSAQGASTGNMLSWQTGVETDASHFEIEKANDPANDFQQIGTVRAKGIASSTYSFVDKSPVSGGMVYYRLKCVDVSGDARYSKVAPVRNSLPAALSVYPNPASNTLNAVIPVSMADATLSITNISSGRTVVLGKYNISSTVSADISSISPGTYLLIVENASARYTAKFVKQ